MKIPAISVAAAIAWALTTVASAEPPDAAVRVQATGVTPRHNPDDVVQPMAQAFRPGPALGEDLPQGPRPPKPVRSADDEVVRPLPVNTVRNLDLDDGRERPQKGRAASPSAPRATSDHRSAQSAGRSSADEPWAAGTASAKPVRTVDPSGQ